MTLRTIESEFSDQLLKQSKEELILDLTLEGPIMTKLHPKILWAKLHFELDSQSALPKVEIPGWNYACFANLKDAQKSFPQIDLHFVGKPWSFFKFLESGSEQAIIDFSPLGTIVLSKNELPTQDENGLHHQLLPLWTHYALSPELWEPHGKWPRFHARLQKLFTQHKLNTLESILGYYSLSNTAAKLESHGFQGTCLEKTYLFVLPWTFSLSDLEKLERIIQQEF